MAVYTTIDNPELYFQTKLYTGNGNDDPGQSITLDGSEDMQPDMVWFKIRSEADYHALYDAVRGATKRIHPDLTSSEGTLSDGLTSFNSDGFTVGDDNGVNKNTATYVAWCWKESATAGFDIVGYTGNGSARTISHSLSAVPGVVAVKSRGGGYGWGIYHHKNTSAPETDYLSWNSTDGTVDDSVFWNDTAPTSSVFSLGTTDAINKNTVTHIAYCWAEKQGFSKFGSYTGNGNADGPFVFCGFRPAFIILKRTDSDSINWNMFDSKRDGFNCDQAQLKPNSNAVEDAGSESTFLDILSTGFKCRNNATDKNDSGAAYVFMAFAETPFVNSSGVPNNAR